MRVNCATGRARGVRIYAIRLSRSQTRWFRIRTGPDIAIVMSDTITVESLKAKLTETLSASHVVSTQLIAYFRSLASQPYSFTFAMVGGAKRKSIYSSLSSYHPCENPSSQGMRLARLSLTPEQQKLQAVNDSTLASVNYTVFIPALTQP